jgi:proteic killer suppression protein
MYQFLVKLANRLEKLSGTLKGFYSIRINDQWRIIFKWNVGNALEVKIIDYH